MCIILNLARIMCQPGYTPLLISRNFLGNLELVNTIAGLLESLFRIIILDLYKINNFK